jgi:NDP-sugar pyrophosphorylase family protein
MRALVLAAGRSTRIRAVAGDLPKPLLPVEGRPILEHTLSWLAESGIGDVWINLHYAGEQIRRCVGTGDRFGLRVRYSEEDPILGTAGAVGKLREQWTDTFLVVYGDNLVRFTLGKLVDAHRQRRTAATLALFDPGRQPSTGIAGGTVSLGADGLIRSFVEGGPGAGGALVNAGVYALEPDVVTWIPPGAFADFGRDVFPRMIAAGAPVGGHVIDGYCLGLDAPEPWSRGLDLIRRGKVTLG